MPELSRIAKESALRPLQNMFNGIENSAYTPGMRACDKKLADLFGGEGAVVMSVYEPIELKRKDGSSRSSAGLPRPQPHNAVPANELIGSSDRGGIIHIYMNQQGLPNKDGHHTSVYVPAGFKQIYEIKSGKQIIRLTLGIFNTQYFYKATLKIYAVFAHVETSKVAGIGEKKANGSAKIGNIGGPKGGIAEGEYIHVHIAFYSKFFGNHMTGTRVDPRDYFCK